MFLIMGTMIGAGYASGQEIWQFFGQDSTVAIVLFMILFSICCFVIMTISYENRTVHYIPVLQSLLGKNLTTLYDTLIVLYLFTTTVIMFAGGGAALEMFNIPFWVGTVIISMCVVCLFFWDVQGMLSMNSFIIPVLVLLLVSVLFSFFYTHSLDVREIFSSQQNWSSAFTFTALNIIPLLAVLSAVGGEIKHKGEIWIASIGSGVVLGGISLLYNQSLVTVSDEMLVYEIPLFAILEYYPYYMAVIMSILLWSAIYTTAASGVFGLISRFRNLIKLPLWVIALLIVLFMLPLTTIGFSTLIAVLYPIYGILNLYILASILIWPILRRKPLS
jgi:uncharacterized membrane protein YkvI